MWTIIAEQPILLSIMIGTISVGLLAGWLQSGSRPMGIAAVLIALLVPVTFLVANWIETDREKILAIIYSTAEAVEANDHESAVVAIVDKATRQRALQELPNYEFDNVSVRNIQVKMVTGSLPQRATVDLDAAVTVSMKRGGFQELRVPRRVLLEFEKQPNESWTVIDYSHRPLAGGPDQYTPNQVTSGLNN